jgi:AbrB family looped-hinge helix DNA binding protein
METTSVTSKGQVTIPKAIRDRLGIRQGTLIEFSWVDSRVELKVKGLASKPFKSGFAMLRSTKPAVAVDFDPASLVKK